MLSYGGVCSNWRQILKNPLTNRTVGSILFNCAYRCLAPLCLDVDQPTVRLRNLPNVGLFRKSSFLSEIWPRAVLLLTARETPLVADRGGGADGWHACNRLPPDQRSDPLCPLRPDALGNVCGADRWVDPEVRLHQPSAGRRRERYNRRAQPGNGRAEAGARAGPEAAA